VKNQRSIRVRRDPGRSFRLWARARAMPFRWRSPVFVLLALCAITAGVWAQHREGAANVDQITTIDVTASRFQFAPATITVNEGDKVRLRLRSSDHLHGLAIKAFRVNAVIPKTGADVIVEFLVDHAGTFDITCSEYCGSGHGGMKGKLVVVSKKK
jgi:heme/copper-type cytochrome/quinol oxidase subunit 2